MYSRLRGLLPKLASEMGVSRVLGDEPENVVHEQRPFPSDEEDAGELQVGQPRPAIGLICRPMGPLAVGLPAPSRSRSRSL